MSRHISPASSSQNSTLPRRRFLKALSAAPLATVPFPAPGQAFLDSDLSVSPLRDRRFATVDRLINRINETCIAQAEASEREGEEDDNGDDVYEVASAKWFKAQRALEKYADKIASNPNPTVTDALLLARIGDFQIVNQGNDVDIHDNERSVPTALRALLLAFGIAPTERTAMTDAQDELDARIASEPPRVEQHIGGSAAGTLIARIRSLAQAKNAALEYEGSLPDDTPQARRASAVTARRIDELQALRDEILAGINRPFDRNNLDDCFRLHPVEEFAVLFELVHALGPWDWGSSSTHGAAAPVLRQLYNVATRRSDYYLEQAERWNARKGGAHV